MTPAVRRLWAKAERSVRAAERLAKSGDADFAASRAYYAMFYAAEALLMLRAVRPSKHAGVLTSLFEQYVKTGVLAKEFHQMLHRAFEARQVGDYGFEETFPAREARTLIRDARKFLRAVHALLTSGA